MDNIFKIIKFLQSEEITFEECVDLKTKTWINRGGTARLWVQPVEMISFEKLVIWCQLNAIYFEVIGNTSNCYFLNDYHPQLVISTLKLNSILEEGNTIICDCGFNMVRLAKYCILKGVAGYEGFIGLPGTVGGATINNAGCYGSLISDIVKKVTIIQNGKTVELNKDELHYSHRNSALKTKEIEGVLTKVTFDISKREDPKILDKRSMEFQLHRKKFQEHTYPNLGSTFCKLDFKKLPFFKKTIYVFLIRTIHLFIKNQLSIQLIEVKLFWLLHSAGSFRNYVSQFGVQCFTWKDEGADQAFIEYVTFVKKNTTNAVLEIDVKKY